MMRILWLMLILLCLSGCTPGSVEENAVPSLQVWTTSPRGLPPSANIFS